MKAENTNYRRGHPSLSQSIEIAVYSDRCTPNVRTYVHAASAVQKKPHLREDEMRKSLIRKPRVRLNDTYMYTHEEQEEERERGDH